MSIERRKSPTGDDADHDNIAVVDAHRTFLVTLVCAVVFIAVVITFIL